MAANPSLVKDTLNHTLQLTEIKSLDYDRNRSLPIICTNLDDDDEELEFIQDTSRYKRKKEGMTISLEETICLADLAKADKYRDENTIRKLVDGKYEPYPVFATSLQTLGEYGAGLELYFTLVKQLGFLFLLISLFSIWPIYQNSQGGGLVPGAAKQEWTYWSIANQKKLKMTNYTDIISQLSQISQNRIVMAIADSIGALCFAFFLVRYYQISKRTVRENFKNNVTAADYAVEIKGLPEHCTSVEEIKKHFESFGEVIEVYLSRKYFGMLQDYKDRAQLSTQLGYERLVSQSVGFTNSKKIKDLEMRICKFDTEMHIRFKKGDMFHDTLPVNRGYLIFNNLDDKKKCLDGFKVHGILCCKKLSAEGVKPFQGNVLKVKQTTEPSNILWENLEITRCQRRWRKSLSITLAVIVLIINTVIVYLIKTYKSSLPTDSECLNIRKINPNESLDYAKNNYKGDTESYCYCKYQSWGSILNNKELGYYCGYFFTKMTTSLILNFSSSFGIVVINYILKLIFKKLSRFEKHSTKTKEELNIMVKVFIAIFINTALITLLVNANFDRISIVYNVPWSFQIFSGQYDDFTRDWYLNVGDSIIFTMVICIFSPHFFTLITLYPCYKLRRNSCYDKYKTQNELNNMYAGPEFDLASRTSIVLNLVFTCYLYSSAMPVLNIIALVALFFIYWIDKFLVLRHYRKPPLLSYHINSSSMKYIPLIIISHCCFAIYMFGADDIFPTHIYFNTYQEIVVRQNSISDRLVSIPGAVHSFVIILTLAFTVIIFFYSEQLSKCKKSKVEQETQDSQGTYKDELEIIKKHGLHTYEILENNEYKSLVLSLNGAAQSVKALRNSFSLREKSLASIKKV